MDNQAKNKKGTAALIVIHILLWIIFVAITAIKGALLLPFFTPIGPLIVGFAANTVLAHRLIIFLASMAIVSLFIYGLRRRASWSGIAINVFALYLWFTFGYIALTYLSP